MGQIRHKVLNSMKDVESVLIYNFENIESCSENNTDHSGSTHQYDFSNSNVEKFVERVKSVFSTSP